MAGVIKFRAWDSLRKVYRDHQDPQTIQAVVFGNDYDGRVIVEQFTGLLDKNGKEIYEGDITRDEHGTIGKIVWEQEYASFVLATNEHSIDFLSQIRIETTDRYCWAVIGNIHEGVK